MSSTRIVWAALLLVAAASCKAAQEVAEMPGELVGAVTHGGKDKKKEIDLEVVRAEALRFADRMVTRVDVASHVFASRADTEEARERALVWRLNTADRAFQTAAQTRPLAALADLLAQCFYERSVHELHWKPKYGDADEPVMSVWTSLCGEGLEIVGRTVSPEVQRTVESVLVRWTESATDPDVLLASGPPQFADLVSKDQFPEAESEGLFSALGLDPFGGIEPATREIARARELGERAVFLAQRMPRTLAWRMELLTLRLARQPNLQTLVESVERVTKTADSLPERVGAEGDKLLQRVSTELATQRAGLTSDLERLSPSVQATLATAEKTLDSAARLAASVESMARAFQGPPEEAGAAAKDADEPPGKPFDPNEYTALAAQTTKLAEELNTTVARLEASMPVAQKNLDEAATRLDASVDRALDGVLRVVLIAIGAIAVAFVVVRLVPSRRRADAG